MIPYIVIYHYYVVINVENLNTQESKEICVDYNFLEGAVERDSNAIIDEENLIFKFTEVEALKNIGFYTYNEKEFISCTKHLEVSTLLKEWNLNSIEFSNNYSNECQIYIAHMLFKSGIMVLNGGLIGQIKLISEAEVMNEKSRMR